MTEKERLRRRRYRASQKGKARQRRFYASEWGREVRRQESAQERARHPDRICARRAVSNALRDGKLARPVICGECLLVAKVQAHHHRGYAQEHWLDVVWVCRACHLETHRKG
jgi:hypothetical protein